MKRIYLIDCPGVVPPNSGDSEEDILLRGVVRVENVENPAQYVDAVLRRAQTRHIERTYEIRHSDYGGDATDFLSTLARNGGRLLRGGEPDVDGVAKMVLNDFLRGKLPWFSAPPKKDGVSEVDGQKGLPEGREGRLGEMPGKGQKRKRDENDAGSVGSDAHNDTAGGDLAKTTTRDDAGSHDTQNGNDGLHTGLDNSEDKDTHDGEAEEEGLKHESEGGQEDSIESPFEAFSSDEEDSGGVPAG